METSKLNPLFLTLFVISVLNIVSYYEAEGQIISTPCVSSAMSFTPCLNYITGSSANGGSPTAECCSVVKSIMTDGVECACLIINGNVPVSIPFSRPLAISLPRLCKTGVPLRCQASGVPLPAPGPAIFGPTPAPVAHSPIGLTTDSNDTAAAAAASPPLAAASADEIAGAPSPDEIAGAPSPDEVAPASSPPHHAVVLGPVANPGIKPVINANYSASNPSQPSFLLLTLLGLMFLIKCN